MCGCCVSLKSSNKKKKTKNYHIHLTTPKFIDYEAYEYHGSIYITVNLPDIFYKPLREGTDTKTE